MWLVAVGLIALVVYLGRQSPGPAATSLPPDNSVPSVGAATVQSPATTGANPYINSTNRVGLRATTQYVDSSMSDYKLTPPSVMWARRQQSVLGGNYLTDQDTQIMTQNVAPVVQTVTNGTPAGQKL
jgi:hypothetical protein